jgi:hypothetical protein
VTVITNSVAANTPDRYTQNAAFRTGKSEYYVPSAAGKRARCLRASHSDLGKFLLEDHLCADVSQFASLLCRKG